jgi:DMSO/TMAO reductase YedYZ molybdopterin-dependent catalytic subunit
MSRSPIITRRRLLSAGTLGTGLVLAGCDKLNQNQGFRSVLESAENLHRRSQRLVGGHEPLAREFSEREMSPIFRANGSSNVADTGYQMHVLQGFVHWALAVDGLVRRPLALPLAALMGLPQRIQITRHDCVEGWSAIGKWQGPQLSRVLDMAGLLPQARYIVFHCADHYGGGAMPYYESIDLIDAWHPQTILACRMNDRPLPIDHGAPLRLRVERQLGYKQAKYVMRIEARASLAGLYGGKGGFWEDAADYAWYAGL